MASLLPDSCLNRILSFVPLKERLGSCSLVSGRFQAAAAAATDEIVGDLAQRPSSLAWIQAHGSSLTRLELCLATQLPQLPCRSLRSLQLDDCSGVVLTDVPQGCPALTRIVVQRSTYGGLSRDSSTRYHALTALQDLRHLQLWELRDQDLAAVGRFDSSLCGLERLTRLDLSNLIVTSESVQHISRLTGLEVVRLARDPRVLDSLEPGPSFTLPVSLRQLDLTCVRLDPSAVLHLTRLESLRLGQLIAVSSTEGLLALPARLPVLQEFSLASCICLNWPASPAAYSALFVNSHLQTLVVRTCAAPIGLWRRVFPAHALLPRMQYLCLEEAHEGSGYFFPACACDTSAVAKACPALDHLHIVWAPNQNPQQQLAPLAQLSALTALWVGCAALSMSEQQACVQALATLTDLRALHLIGPRTDINPGLVLPLTALRDLNMLCVFTRPMMVLLSEPEGGSKHRSSVPMPAQLLRWCWESDEDCHGPIIEQLAAQQLKAACRLDNTDSGHGGWEQAAPTAAAQGKEDVAAIAARAEAAAAAAQADAAAARAEAAELREPLQVLQRQMQQLMQRL